MNNEVPEEIAALRRRLAEIEKLMAAAEQRPDAAGPEVDVDQVMRRASAQGRVTGNASRRAKETQR